VLGSPAGLVVLVAVLAAPPAAVAFAVVVLLPAAPGLVPLPAGVVLVALLPTGPPPGLVPFAGAVLFCLVALPGAGDGEGGRGVPAGIIGRAMAQLPLSPPPGGRNWGTRGGVVCRLSPLSTARPLVSPSLTAPMIGM